VRPQGRPSEPPVREAAVRLFEGGVANPIGTRDVEIPVHWRGIAGRTTESGLILVEDRDEKGIGSILGLFHIPPRQL
jgi:hypothetical protein